MHIEFRIPDLRTQSLTAQRNAYLTATRIVKSRMALWADSNPNCPYNVAITEEAVKVQFDNPAHTTLWAMTWDQHRGNFHATSWKRIHIVE